MQAQQQGTMGTRCRAQGNFVLIGWPFMRERWGCARKRASSGERGRGGMFWDCVLGRIREFRWSKLALRDVSFKNSEFSGNTR